MNESLINRVNPLQETNDSLKKSGESNIFSKQIALSLTKNKQFAQKAKERFPNPCLVRCVGLLRCGGLGVSVHMKIYSKSKIVLIFFFLLQMYFDKTTYSGCKM